MMHSEVLAALGPQAFRLAGLLEGDIPLLGRLNLLRLVHFVDEYLIRGDLDRAERLEVLVVKNWLNELIADAAEHPRLPALRSGLPFSVDDVVRIYMGDTPGGPVGWLQGTVCNVVKAYKSNWKGALDGGYYWRVTALLSDGSQLPFSSTEPRVMLESDLVHLRAQSDSSFFRVFCRAEIRDWTPIWALESSDSTFEPEGTMEDWLRAELL